MARQFATPDGILVAESVTRQWNALGAQLSEVATTVSGTLAATEAGEDTASVSGNVMVAGTFAAVESGADTFSASGVVVVQGTFGAVEAGADTLSASGKVIISGALAVAETGQDTFSSVSIAPVPSNRTSYAPAIPTTYASQIIRDAA